MTRAATGQDSPFIIWTFRRTGGTRLGDVLFQRSSHDKVEHEPFNNERIYGGVNERYRETGDDAALRVELADICRRGVLIKHCLELMPPGLNQALAAVASDAGYRHLFLYRRRPLGRLLSLHYSQQSGVWGRLQAQATAVDEAAILARPLPVARLLAHERMSRARMRDCYRAVCAQGGQPVLAAFEDIYGEPDQALVRDRLLAILDALGMSRSEGSDREFLAATLTGEQGTRSRYTQFPNYPEFAAAVEALGEFSPAEPGVVIEVLDLPDWVETFTVWPPERRAGSPAEGVVAGILLPKEAREGQLLFVSADGESVVASTGLPSRGFASRAPANALSGRARFRFDQLRLAPGLDGECVWVDQSGQRTPLARVSFE